MENFSFNQSHLNDRNPYDFGFNSRPTPEPSRPAYEFPTQKYDFGFDPKPKSGFSFADATIVVLFLAAIVAVFYYLLVVPVKSLFRLAAHFKEQANAQPSSSGSPDRRTRRMRNQ